nr:MAG TPA: hypothetical protein [Caudoviricetes sp.]
MPCRLMSLKTGKKKQPAKSRRATGSLQFSFG